MIKDGIYDKATLAPSPNKGGFIKPRLIIVHDTAGGLDAAGSISWLRNPVAKASAHFVVARDGKVTQLVSCNLKAWHAGVSSYKGVKNVNDFSIGIEIVNPGVLSASGSASARAGFGGIFSRKQYAIEELEAQKYPIEGAFGYETLTSTHPAALWMPYPQAQLDAVLALCLDIREAYNIEEVAPHWYIAPGRKVDTNPLFPLRWLQGKLEGRNTPDLEFEEVHKPGPGPVVLPPLKLDPTAVIVRYAIPIGEGKVRAWPSFNKNEIKISPGHGPLKIIGEGEYVIEGEGVPDELSSVTLPWWKVEFWDNEQEETFTAFLLKSNARIV